jgi:uncharacterized protein YbdZ (MbtH family)
MRARIVKTGLMWAAFALFIALIVGWSAHSCRAQERDAYQQWIHDNRPSCCNHRDCAPATVEWTPAGWRVAGADNLIPEKLVIAWPFAVPYACIINRHARCLFLNSGG